VNRNEFPKIVLVYTVYFDTAKAASQHPLRRPAMIMIMVSDVSDPSSARTDFCKFAKANGWTLERKGTIPVPD